MQAAFYSPENLGGVFIADSEVPDNIMNDIQSEKAASLFPQFELKQKMFICITAYEKMSDSLRNKIGQQGQMLRGHGFLRLTSIELKKALDRMLCQVHHYNHLASQAEVDRMINLHKARDGDFDKVAVNTETAGKGK